MLNLKNRLNALILKLFGATPVNLANSAPSNNATNEQETQLKQRWRTINEQDAYYVELTLEEVAPFKNSAPSLFINGKKHEAVLSADRKTLRALIGSLDVENIKEVITPQQFFAQLQCHAKANRALHPNAPPEHSAKSMAPDPTASPRFDVEVLHYDDGDEALELPDAPDGKKVELRAVVYLPKGTTEPLPVIIFLHGVHDTCYRDDVSDGKSWPCRIGSKPIPSYEGYSTIATELASHGYAVASLSANGVNSLAGSKFPDIGSQLRGHLILAHLDLLTDANEGNRLDLKALKGRLNLTKVGLLGHSRGGDGISRAVTLNRLLNKKYGILAALFLGATNENNISVPDTHTAVIHPLLDGDAANLAGQIYLDTSRVAFNDSVFRCSVVLTGANHNYFNSVWSPNGEYPGGANDAVYWGDIIVKPLTQEEQRLLAAFYITGFFRLTLGEEQQFLPLFDGSPVTVPVLPEAEVRSSAHTPRLNRYDIQSFETLFTADVASTPGKWSWAVIQGIGEVKNKASFLNHPRYTHTFFHSFLNLKGTAPSSPAKLVLHPKEDEPAIDISRYSHLNFYATYQFNENPNQLVKIDITLGNTELASSTQQVILVPTPEIALGIETFLLQHVSLPLSDFLIDLSQPVDALSFTLPEGGNIYLSDIAFGGQITIHEPNPTTLPFISIKDVYIEPAQTDQTLEIEVTLSAPSSHKISLHLKTDIVHLELGTLALHGFATFEPGVQTATTNYTIPAGYFRGTNTSFDIPYWISSIKTLGLSNALFDRDYAVLKTPKTFPPQKN